MMLLKKYLFLSEFLCKIKVHDKVSGCIRFYCPDTPGNTVRIIRNTHVDCLKFLYSLNITNDLLTYLIISHPHADHISAIERIHKECKPSYLTKRSDLDWSRVRKTNTENKSLDYYLSNFFPPINYYSNGQLPDWGDGFSIQNFWIPSIALIDIISATDNSYVNN